MIQSGIDRPSPAWLLLPLLSILVLIVLMAIAVASSAPPAA
jgi:hypothetical protein